MPVRHLGVMTPSMDSALTMMREASASSAVPVERRADQDMDGADLELPQPVLRKIIRAIRTAGAGGKVTLHVGEDYRVRKVTCERTVVTLPCEYHY